MQIQITRVEHKDVEAMRDLYRNEANCQIIHDSAIRREIADPYLIRANGHVAGYGAVWNKYYEGRVMEFYTLPQLRADARPMFRELISVSAATAVEAQTNMPLMLTMLYDFADDITVENILFADTLTTHLSAVDGCVFRPKATEDTLFEHKHEPDGDWVIEVNGDVVASGGFLCHYNPPYGDIYMEVTESARGKGFGSYLVQELKRVCYEAGNRPAARCNPTNFASRRTLEKAGLLPCGRMLAGKIAGI